jgi:hypothetical protein
VPIYTESNDDQRPYLARLDRALRADVVAADLLLQFVVSSAAELTAPHAPELWRRYLALVLDGLRTPNPHPLPQPGLWPLSLSIRRTDDLRRRSRRGRDHSDSWD